MSIQIKEVITKEDRKKFVNLQFELYKDNKYWAPPFIKGELKYLDPKYNPAFKFSDVKFFIAFKDNKVVGRIGAIVNKKYNEKTGRKYVRLSKPEFIDDFEVSQALINKVIEFGKEKGMSEIHGPLGFTNLDNQGLLIEGFEEVQSVACVYHLPYYKDHFEKLGFQKENDWIEFQLNLTDDVIAKANKGSNLVLKRYGFELLLFKSVKEMKLYTTEVFDIINESFAKLPYVVPFDEELKQYYVDKYFDILNPKYVTGVKKDDELIGFFIVVPSLTKTMQKANGKASIRAFFDLKKAKKKNTVADLFLVGVKEKYQNFGVAVPLFTAIQNALKENGISTFEVTGVFEINKAVITNWKSYDNRQHKRRRCYVKEIN
ncbi:MAG: GNAT family N-acetyltransferase [Bacteroidales bacterium]|nr:GNAT family N-acetyltransferase [Bacteroidales bacterium]